MGEMLELDHAAPPQRGRPVPSEGLRLRDRILWTAWSLAEGGEHSLRRRYVVSRETADGPLMMRADEFDAYRQGRRSISSTRLRHLVSLHPSLVEIALWPTALLDRRPTTKRAIEAWLTRYRIAPSLVGVPRYLYPVGTLSGQENRNPVTEDDLERLYERGDAYGFFALLAAYRLYHLERRSDRQWYAGRYLIRALPGICREPCVQPHSETLIAITERLLTLLPDTSVPIAVDTKIITEQVHDPSFEPCRGLRLRARERGEIVPQPRDPIVPLRYEVCTAEGAPLLLAGIQPLRPGLPTD